MTLARLASAFEIGIDQAVQLEAAERLVNGQGLTSTYFGSHPLDLAQPTIAEPLTWFPPGFSVVMAGFLASGIPLLASLRILYGAVTLIGWTGWARVTDRLVQPCGRDCPRVAAVAALAPVFLTPSWSGTDVFLWAAVPFVVLLLSASVARRALWRIAAAGLLVGVLCLVRYAAAFLAPAALFIVWQASAPDVRRFAGRAAVFGTAALLGILPVVLHRPPLSWQGAVGFAEPAEVTRRPALLNVVQDEFPAIAMGLIGSPLPYKTSEKLAVPLLSQAIGLTCAAGVLVLPVLAWRYPPARGLPLSGNLGLSLTALQFCLSLFLIALTVSRPAESPSFLVFTRYYLPVSLASLLVWALFADGRAGPRLAIFAGRVVMVLLVFYYLGYLPGAAIVRRDTVELSRVVMGVTPARSRRYQSTSLDMPPVSNSLYSIRETTRRKVAELHRRYPDAMFFIENYHYFVYGWDASQGPVPGTHMRRFLQPQQHVRHGDPVRIPGGVMRSGLEFWQAAYAPRPLRVFWVLNNPDAIRFVPAPNRRRVFDDRFERTTIVMSEFPPGKLTPPGGALTPMTPHPDAAKEGTP